MASKTYNELIAATIQYNNEVSKQNLKTEETSAYSGSETEKSFEDVSESSSYLETQLNNTFVSFPVSDDLRGSTFVEDDPFQEYTGSSVETTGENEENVVLEVKNQYHNFPNGMTYGQTCKFYIISTFTSLHGLIYILFFILSWCSLSTVITFPIFYALDRSAQKSSLAQVFIFGLNWPFMILSIVFSQLNYASVNKALTKVAIKKAHQWVEKTQKKHIEADLEQNGDLRLKDANVKMFEANNVTYRQIVKKHYTQTEEEYANLKGKIMWSKIIRHIVYVAFGIFPLSFAILLIITGNLHSMWYYQILTEAVTIAVSVPSMIWLNDMSEFLTK